MLPETIHDGPANVGGSGRRALVGLLGVSLDVYRLPHFRSCWSHSGNRAPLALLLCAGLFELAGFSVDDGLCPFSMLLALFPRSANERLGVQVVIGIAAFCRVSASTVGSKGDLVSSGCSQLLFAASSFTQGVFARSQSEDRTTQKSVRTFEIVQCAWQRSRFSCTTGGGGGVEQCCLQSRTPGHITHL